MRDAAQGVAGVRFESALTSAELKQMSVAARSAARDSKTELQRTEREGMRPLRDSADRTGSTFRRMAQNAGRNLRGLKTVAAGVRSELDRIKGVAGSVNGRLASLGVGIAVGQQFGASASLDRTLIRTAQTAGMTGEQREEWRSEGFRIAKQYGIDPDAIYAGGDTLLANGLSVKATFASADAIGQASAVTSANSEVLAGALTTGAAAYGMDLEKAGVALDMLQKMTVAGREGAAELENLSSIFPKMGSKARSAGMSFAQSLAFVETLSNLEREPERLGTLAESTLRIFNNGQYRERVTKTTGIPFFDADGRNRNPLDVMSDLKRKYGAMQTDEQRARFSSTVFKGMDLDTQRGMAFLLQDANLDTFARQSQTIENSGQPFTQDLKDNTTSASGTAGRLRATLREAMDRMAQPINKVLADTGTYLLDDLDLSGGQLLAGGAGILAGGYYAGRGAKKLGGVLGSKLFGGADTLKNIAVGRALEEATGVQSVFVTNWPNGGGMGSVSVDVTKPQPRRHPGRGPAGGAAWEMARGFGQRILPHALLAGAAVQVGGSSAQQTDHDRLAMLPRDKLLSAEQKAYHAAFYQARIGLADQAPPGLPYAERQEWLNSNAGRLAQQQTGLTSSGSVVADVRAWADILNGRLLASALEVPPRPGDLLRMTPDRAPVLPPQPSAGQREAPSQPVRPPVVPGPVSENSTGWAARTVERLARQQSALPSMAERTASISQRLMTAPGDPPSGAELLGVTTGLAAPGTSIEQPVGLAGESLHSMTQMLQSLVGQMQNLVGQPLVVDVRTDSDHIYATIERRVGIEARRGR
ncbi:phage tail tape measure protein [Stutzerimonas kirkiae]|uniref:phage tail tape measure protein n=1 Tax=Stutzerimonas kirkiae TaxID=2211392 RepID=UPI0013F1489D|nr:phage tail tape measure protein [Stutzerimonas kirkiae]